MLNLSVGKVLLGLERHWLDKPDILLALFASELSAK
jgi:hypothetical protein